MLEKTSKKDIINIWQKFLLGPVFLAPVLGPVFTGGNDPKILLSKIIDNAGTKSFISFDKNKRWFKKKPENLLLAETTIGKHGIFLVSHDNFFNLNKIFYYSRFPIDSKIYQQAKKIAESANKSQSTKAIVYSFNKPTFTENYITHNIYLKKITRQDQALAKPEAISFYSDLRKEEQNTFSLFQQFAEHDGLAFLWNEYLNLARKTGPVICRLDNSKIVGAIGPLDIRIDAYGQTFLQPPYFGVLDNFQKAGTGTMLWKRAMAYAYRNKAEYAMVQNTPDSSAGKFYTKNGLSIGATVYSFQIIPSPSPKRSLAG